MDQLEVKSIGKLHPITIRIVKALEKGIAGEEITDKSLSEIAGIDVSPTTGKKGYCYLYSAIRHCESIGIKWHRTPGTGKIRCLNAEETVDTVGTYIPRIRKIANRQGRLLATVDPEQIPAVKRPQSTALAAQLGAIGLLSKNKATKKLIECKSVPKIEDALSLFI